MIVCENFCSIMWYFQEPRISKPVFFWKCFSLACWMHSKSLGNKTIQASQVRCEHFILFCKCCNVFDFPSYQDKERIFLIISLMNQLLYGASENVIFQIGSTVLSLLCDVVVSFLHSSYLGRSSILWPQKAWSLFCADNYLNVPII